MVPVGIPWEGADHSGSSPGVRGNHIEDEERETGRRSSLGWSPVRDGLVEAGMVRYRRRAGVHRSTCLPLRGRWSCAADVIGVERILAGGIIGVVR